MQKISLQKRSFFNSIGLDINNLPSELQIKSNSIQTKIPKEDFKFLSQEHLTIPQNKYFRLKNLFGTVDINLDNKTWIEIFSDNEKTDEMIKLYFKNPNYYYKELKKLDQSDIRHNTAIVLYEDNGKFFIKDGVARLSLMMIKYLLEMSRAQSKEEKVMINKQYIFSATVRATPKDRDVMYLINMILDIYGQKLKLQKIDNDNECSYVMKYDEKKLEINSKKDFENFLRNSYLPKDCKSTENLLLKLKNMSKVGIEYKENEEIVDQFLVMGKIFPNYEIFIKYYKKMCKYKIEDKLVDKLDLSSVTYDIILKKLIKIVKQEEINMSKLEKKKSSVDEEKTSSKKKVEKVVKEKAKKVKEEEQETKKVTKKEEKASAKAVSKTTLKSEKDDEKKVASLKSSAKAESAKSSAKAESARSTAKVESVKNTSKAEIVNEKEKIDKAKELFESQLKGIKDNIEMTYYKLKTEESKIFDLANSTNVELNIDRINDDSINANINSIKENSFVLRNKIEKVNDIKELNDINELLKDLKNISNNKNIPIDYDEEMKSIYMVCFNKNAQKMITDSKLKKLDEQRKEIESEKCSFFSKLIGKAKLKQAKLDNISLKEQLILTESQFTSNSYTSIEDGLSDIYAYIKTEEDESCLVDIKIYLKNIESNSQIKSMTDKTKLNQKTKEKIEQQRNLPQLVLAKEKRKFFSKAQINMVQEKNNELKRVIQINRANSLKLQNTGVIPIIGNMKSTKSVRAFLSNLSQIDSSLRSQNS